MLSWVIGPPDDFNFSGSFLVKSGLIISHDCPSFSVTCTWFEKVYSFLGLCFEKIIGKFHWNLYFIPSAPWPIGLSGQTLIDLKDLASWLTLDKNPS